ncbi:polyamine ABC transporter ATP-binding protein [Verticiella sediminum]|uniref:Spermidine/putrescine import ATP-binding protein PotA n=1 Tax=Verticiella sediminum TaxID=1247510 RepID=A0A556A7C0_9BURK|nr:polyamine ABC transporter ATP-binding protein [Verticiella sediminum]TSH88779.1 polyamine ABC transporter ATP-binding protein [Verticiella sediminum]
MSVSPAGAQPAGSRDDDAFLRIEHVSKQFGDTRVVRDLSLAIGRGELFALLGSSGSGKSTLLRMLAGLETVSAGRIWLDGQDITDMPAYRRPVNMMFQSYALFPHMSVQANVAFGLKQEGVARGEIAERVASTLELVQMAQYAGRKPAQLSGGQQQRVALARSLVKRPRLLLLDEPMSALDKKIRQQTQIELARILEQVGVTCVMVTHDQEEAMTLADRLAIMSEGEIVQCGTPHDVYEYPNSRFVAGFIGSTNLFEAVIVEDEADHIALRSDDMPQPLYVNHGVSEPLGTAVAASVRPERIAVTRTRPQARSNWVEGVVEHLAYMGAHTLYHVRLASGKLVAASVPSLVLATEGAPALGETAFLRWSADAATVLSA